MNSYAGAGSVAQWSSLTQAILDMTAHTDLELDRSYVKLCRILKINKPHIEYNRGCGQHDPALRQAIFLCQ